MTYPGSLTWFLISLLFNSKGKKIFTLQLILTIHQLFPATGHENEKYSILADLTAQVISHIKLIYSHIIHERNFNVPRGNQAYFLKYSDKTTVFDWPMIFSSSSGAAALIFSTDPKCFSRASFVLGPTPFMASRSDLTISEERFPR